MELIMRLHELKEKRAQAQRKAKALVAAAEKESRDLTDQEKADFDTLEAEVRKYDDDIRRAGILAEMERRESGEPLNGGNQADEFDREQSQFSIRNAILMQLPASETRGMDFAREKEVSQELARRSGKTLEGVMVPWAALARKTEKRVLTVGGDGAHLVQTEVQDVIHQLQPMSATMARGARVATDLRGNLGFPRNDSSAPAAQWFAENSAINSGDYSFEQVLAQPRHLGFIAEFSRRLLLQPSQTIEEIVRVDALAKLAAGIDAGALVGAGAPAPSGVSGLATGTVDSSGNNPTWAQVVSAIAQAENSNTPGASFGWILNAFVKAKFRTITRVTSDAGAGFLMADDGSIGGYPSSITSALAGDPNSSPVVAGEALFGNWSEMIVCLWNELELIVNPYESTAYSKGNVSIRAIADADVVVRHDDAFTYWEAIKVD
jgi:HK97 family phage major capsid protein